MTGPGASTVAYRADVEGLPELVRSSANFGRVLQQNLQRNIKQAGLRILENVRQEVRSGSYSIDVGLRDGIAAGLRVETYVRSQIAGVQLLSTGSGLPAGRKVMAAAWQAPRFRHEVFGHPVMVEQDGHPYFFKTIEANSLIVQRAVEQAMTATAQTLTGA